MTRKTWFGVAAVIALAEVMTACVPKKKHLQNEAVLDPSTIPATYGNSQTNSYRLADVDCSKGTGVDTLLSGTFFQFMGGAIATKNGNFTGFGGNPLHSAGVNETKVGMVGEQTCTNGSCSSSMTIQNHGYPLKFCREKADFPRDSIEGVSLTTLIHLNNVQAFYQSIGQSNPTLANLEMMVMPTFTTTNDGERELKTDNLSYYPVLDSKPYVVVFPKSKVGEKLWPGYNLWESPWVIAHEASHHVFRTNFMAQTTLPSSALGMLDKSNPILQLPKTRPIAGSKGGINRLAGIGFEKREVTMGDIWGAMNEGFADLFGYYSVGESKDIATGFNCFHQTRDVASAIFADGTRKAFTDGIINSFTSDIHEEPASRPDVLSCEVPDFQGIHTIGAIFAYSFDQLLSQSPRVVNEANKTIAKANLSLEWVHRISRLNLTDANKSSLGQILRVAVDVATEPGIQPEQCRLVKDLFPAYASDWLRESNYGAALKCP